MLHTDTKFTETTGIESVPIQLAQCWFPVVSKSRIRGAGGEELSGLEGLLAVVGLEVTTEGIRTGTGPDIWRERFSNTTSSKSVRRVTSRERDGRPDIK